MAVGERPDYGDDRNEKRPRHKGEIVHVLIRLAELPELIQTRTCLAESCFAYRSEGVKQFREPHALIRWPMEAVNERELVERCRPGDEGAFQELVDRYKDLVFALIARTVQDRSRAEDLAQDVFLRIHRGPPLFPRRSASVDLDLPHRRQRLPAGSRAVPHRPCRWTTSAADADAGGVRSAVRRSRAARSARKGDRAAAGELPAAHRRALPRGRAVRGARGSAAAAARHREDAAVPREAAAAADAGDGSEMSRGWGFGVR